VLQYLDVTCFKLFKNAFKKEEDFVWQKNYFEPNKVILVKWMDKALQQSLKKEKRKSLFKIDGI